jgi:formylglycine-generating enzyme required for sulfatase activity
MHGNVGQWCDDWYGTYPNGPVVDPRGPSQGKTRIKRGGGWIAGPSGCRSAYRASAEPEARTNFIGFRVCFSLE